MENNIIEAEQLPVEEVPAAEEQECVNTENELQELQAALN